MTVSSARSQGARDWMSVVRGRIGGNVWGDTGCSTVIGARGGHGPPVLMGVSVYRYVRNGPHAGASVLLTSLRYS